MDIRVVFIFDEARKLLDSNKPTSTKESNFVLLRRAFTYFPRKIGCLAPLALMTDTTAKISNFAPIPSLEASARATTLPRGMFPPFYLIANVDIWAPKHRDTTTLQDLEDWKYYCLFGRPHWGALAKQIMDSGSPISINDLMSLARIKLLGRNEDFADIGEFSMGEAMAILGVRVCVDLVPQCQLSDTLVAQHMRTLYFVSEDRERMITGYFSEPVLVQAAAQLTNESAYSPSANRWSMLLRMLVGSLRNGMVDAGFQGELVARILLLLAWDKCCLAKLRENETEMSTAVFLRAVPLLEFLESLLNIDDDVTAHLTATIKDADNVAWVRCSHFVKIDYVPNTEQLLLLFKRGAAAITKELQPGVDLVIPIVFAKDRFSITDTTKV